MKMFLEDDRLRFLGTLLDDFDGQCHTHRHVVGIVCETSMEFHKSRRFSEEISRILATLLYDFDNPLLIDVSGYRFAQIMRDQYVVSQIETLL